MHEKMKLKRELMDNEKKEQLKKLVDKIQDINEVAISFLDYINISDVNSCITVLQHERDLLNKAYELIEEEAE